MDDDGTGQRACFDRDAIRDVLARLARGEDRRDAALIRAAFRPDATIDYGIFQGDFAAYLDWVVPGAEAIANTQHVLGQSFIELAGDRAKVETHVISYHRVEASEAVRDICIGGRYLDTFERQPGGWRIAARIMLYDWVQDWGNAADWRQGIMGLPFSAPHFTGRAHGDHSVDFFGPDAAGRQGRSTPTAVAPSSRSA